MWTNLTKEEQQRQFQVTIIFKNYADAVDFWKAAQNPDTQAIAGSIDYVDNNAFADDASPRPLGSALHSPAHVRCRLARLKRDVIPRGEI